LMHDESRVVGFREKANDDGGMINGGFFVLEPQATRYINGDDTGWGRRPMSELVRAGVLGAYRPNGFLPNMDTLRHPHMLEEMWASGAAPWKVWRARVVVAAGAPGDEGAGHRRRRLHRVCAGAAARRARPRGARPRYGLLSQRLALPGRQGPFAYPGTRR